MIERHEFPAMGGSVEVQLVDGRPDQIQDVIALFERYEETLSRFRPHSELQRLNATEGEAWQASPVLFAALEDAERWRVESGGLFDPAIIEVLERSGYDGSFDVASKRPAAQPARRLATTAPRYRLNHTARTVELNDACRLDLGGIGKGFTVDRAIEALAAGANACINASGDLYAAGHGPDGDGWSVGVQDPFDPSQDAAVLRVTDRGVATSGAEKRSWTHLDRRYHHLIDPGADACAESDIVSISVVARCAADADVMATVAYILGADAGLSFVEEHGGDAIAFQRHGEMRTTPGVAEYLL